MEELPIKEYIKKNYVSKKKIEKLMKCKMELVSQLRTFTTFREPNTQEQREIMRLETEIHELMDLLEE